MADYSGAMLEYGEYDEYDEDGKEREGQGFLNDEVMGFNMYMAPPPSLSPTPQNSSPLTNSTTHIPPPPLQISPLTNSATYIPPPPPPPSPQIPSYTNDTSYIPPPPPPPQPILLDATTAELSRFLAEPRNLHLFQRIINGYTNDELEFMVGVRVSDLETRKMGDVLQGSAETNNTVDTNDHQISSEMIKTGKRQHQTNPPEIGSRMRLPKDASPPYPFQQHIIDDAALMTGTDYTSKFYQYHQSYFQDLKAIDRKYLTDSEHLEKLRVVNKSFGEKLTKLRNEHFPAPAKRTEACSALNRRSGSRLDGIVFDGQVLFLEGHHGQHEKKEPKYTGPKLPSNFWASASDVDTGFTVGQDMQSRLASMYRRYVANVRNADALQLSDEDFGDILKVISRKYSGTVSRIRRDAPDEEALRVINGHVRKSGAGGRPPKEIGVEQSELGVEGQHSVVEEAETDMDHPYSRPSKRQRVEGSDEVDEL